jgi:hypothetical protein
MVCGVWLLVNSALLPAGDRASLPSFLPQTGLPSGRDGPRPRRQSVVGIRAELNRNIAGRGRRDRVARHLHVRRRARRFGAVILARCRYCNGYALGARGSHENAVNIDCACGRRPGNASLTVRHVRCERNRLAAKSSLNLSSITQNSKAGPN